MVKSYMVNYMINSFGFSLDVTVMISILQEDFLHEKKLKAINLYWFHNDASEENNELNDHSKKSRING